jgi:2-octaprenyl-6-methoxyphenol hydroxylase
LNLAIVGAGPAGLALALLAARRLPDARITVFDARPADKDIAGDARTLALALGSVQLLQRLGAWEAHAAQPILQVHVSQAPPTLELGPMRPEVHIRADEQAVPMLGAVLGYGALVAPMQRAWQAACAADPQRLRMRFGTPVVALKGVAGGVEVDAGIADTFDLAVVAEGGVFADQAPKGLTHDYLQNAWVGQVLLQGGEPGLAVERFTRSGPVALLPLPPRPGLADDTRRAALVWCVDASDDPARELDAAQRAQVLRTLLPPEAGRVLEVSDLKCFPLGLNARRTLVDGRTVRIGNAAQTLHPVAGQGLNLGLRDAYALVDALRDAAERGRDVDAALARIEWARAPDRWAMIAATDFLARSFTWRWPGLPALRGLGLAALQALPPLKGALARRMMFGSR